MDEREEEEFQQIFQTLPPSPNSSPQEFTRDIYIAPTHFQRIWEEHHMLGKLQHINGKISQELELDRLLVLIMDGVIELTSAERGFLILIENDVWDFRVQRNIDKEPLKDPQFKISRSVVARALETGQAILTTNAKEDERFSTVNSVHNLRLVSILCVPFTIRNKVIGAVYIDNRLQIGAFGHRQLKMLETFSTQAAIAIENANLYRSLEECNRRLDQFSNPTKSKS